MDSTLTTGSDMAVRLNRSANEQAQQLINSGHLVLDNRGDWSASKPTTAKDDEFIRERGFGAYARWHLGINEERKENTKERYEFPYGDFTNVHRSGVMAAESRAGQYGHRDIELAAAKLLGMLESLDNRAAD